MSPPPFPSLATLARDFRLHGVLFPSCDLSFERTDAPSTGFDPVSECIAVDRGYPLEMGRGIDTQPTRKIDPLLAPDLLYRPFVACDEDWRRSLASRSPVRGHDPGLPSGQTGAGSSPR